MSAVLAFFGNQEDKNYLPRLKSCVADATVYVVLEQVTTITEVVLYCKKKGVTGVFSTNRTLLAKLSGAEKPSLDSYAGSYYLHSGIEFVFIDPLEHLVKVNYGTFLTRRFISKLSQPDKWNKSTPFKWSIVTPASVDSLYSLAQSAYLIAVDIETYRDNLAIRCVGYTVVTDRGDSFSSESFVIPLDSEWALAWVRKFNNTAAPKIFQNGKYDCAYLARYNAPVHNYLWDTAHLFHCTYSELPKDLGFLNSFYVRESAYHKDLAHTNDLEEYYRYNALDTWATANVFLAQMQELPDYAFNNYLLEFPLVFPCHMAEMTGVARDMNKLKAVASSVGEKIEKESKSLDKILSVQNFNVNSPKQMKQMMAVIGCADIAAESCDEKHLSKAAFRHPLNSLIIDKILEIRGLRKLVSTYLVEGKELDGRILYALNPHGTDTGRLASREHHFWCGLQVQNIPRGVEVKSTIRADDGFRFAECDLEQAESRDTAHIAGDEVLISAVSGERDFHSTNAAAFFGKPYDTIYDDEKKKTKDKPLRDLAKRVNHGANYLMGANVLVDTMGLANIYFAQAALRLPKLFTPKQVAEDLLARFHRTYPKLSKVFYPGVIHEVTTSNKLSSTAKWIPVADSSLYNPKTWYEQTGGWVRYCFGRPDINKSDLNAYVAHVPQSLNAMTLNKAFMDVFYNIALHPVKGKNFKLCAQIHDSILFQFREGHEYLAQEVKERMEIPLRIKGYDGVTREFVVPAAIKAGKDGKGSKYWSETE